jgi:hypothetical protein
VKGLAQGAGNWVKSHPLQAGLIGTGVAVGSLLVGWLVFKALKKGKNKKSRYQARSIDLYDDVLHSLPSTEEEKLELLAEIDMEDEEFLQFMELLKVPSLQE